MRPARSVLCLATALTLSACGGGNGSSSAAGATSTSSAGGGTAVAHFEGRTYRFTGGQCSDVLDVNQFVFQQGDKVQNYFNISVLDLDKPVDHGGTFKAALLYADNGKFIFNPTEATLKVKDDLSGGTFSGKDFATGKPVTGSYTC